MVCSRAMAFTVGELARMTGLTVRALHHYDAIGLVRPSQRTAAGYRLYDDGDVRRLYQVLMYRELGLPLDAIAAALDDADGADELLRQHRDALVAKRARLDAMIAELDARLTRGGPMTADDWKAMFDGFDPSVYEAEVKERWGETDAYEESARRARAYGKDDWARYQAEARANGERLIALMRAGAAVTDPAVQAAVDEHRLLIERWFYPCSKEMHKALGAMYTGDPRFRATLDAQADGYAEFLSEAIAAS